MRDQVLIGLLCQNLNPVSFYNYCSDLPVEIVKFKSSGIDRRNRRIKGIFLKNGEWVKAETPMPDAVYNRCYTDSMKTVEGLGEIIGRRRIFNEFTLFGKYVIFRVLSKSKKLKHLAIPTIKYSNEALIRLLNHQGAALIKPSKGSLGSHVYKITVENNIYKAYLHSTLSPRTFEKAESLFNFLAGIMKWKSFIIQPFINFIRLNGHMFDMRLLIQKNGRGIWEVTADASRVCYRSSFVSNLVYALKGVEEVLSGTKYEEVLLPYLKKVSIQVATILEASLCHLGEISIDFGIDIDGRLWIIEINGKPDKLMFQQFNSEIFEKTFRTPIEYALYLSKH